MPMAVGQVGQTYRYALEAVLTEILGQLLNQPRAAVGSGQDQGGLACGQAACELRIDLHMWRILPKPVDCLGAAGLITPVRIQHSVATGAQFRSSIGLGMSEVKPVRDDAIELNRMALECGNAGDVILIEKRQALGPECLLWDVPASRRADLELGPRACRPVGWVGNVAALSRGWRQLRQGGGHQDTQSDSSQST